MAPSDRPDPARTHMHRAAMGLVGLVVGLVLLLVGITVLSGANDEVPPPGNPMVRTGTLPPASAPTATADGGTVPRTAG